MDMLTLDMDAHFGAELGSCHYYIQAVDGQVDSGHGHVDSGHGRALFTGTGQLSLLYTGSRWTG